LKSPASLKTILQIFDFLEVGGEMGVTVDFYNPIPKRHFLEQNLCFRTETT